MGTRGAFGFRLNGEDKVTYNHFDSYPSGLGKDLLKELSGQTYESLVATAKRITLVNSDSKPTEEQIASLKKYANTGVSSKQLDEWYVLLRETQGTLAPWLSGDLPVMIDSHRFLADSLFCEYAYIVNLDGKCFEVYHGFNKDPNAEGRYANAGIAVDGDEKEEDRYYGVALFKAFPLDEIFGKNELEIAALETQCEAVEVEDEV